MKNYVYLLTFFIGLSFAYGQNNFDYWQQLVDYTMDVNIDVKTFQYEGTQKLIYSNNSPDDLEVVYYHLFYNAFQPGSEMDVRSRTIADADPRVSDRISKLSNEDVGFLNVVSLTQNGKPLNYSVAGSVLEVQLNTAIKSGESAIFEMVLKGRFRQ